MALTPDRHEHYSHRGPWLRAAVMGAMDGLGSLASLIIGLQGGGASYSATVLGGVTGAVAGALSMGVSEYVSVSTQRDAELTDLAAETIAQDRSPASELQELARIYESRGLETTLALEVARQLSVHNPVLAHARDELGIDPKALSNPCLAASVGCCWFLLGACAPVIGTALAPQSGSRIIVCVASTAIGFVVAGLIFAHLGGGNPIKVVSRLLIGGALELGTTFAVGRLIALAAR